MKKSILWIIPIVFIVAACSKPKKPSIVEVWSVCDACSAPESVYFDEGAGVLYVSNISGAGDQKDGVGWISKVDFNGKAIEPKWVSGLNAPKGMRAKGDLLWVSDIDEVVAVDKKTGTIIHRKKVEGAKFLNDVAIGDDGTVYVSGTLTSTIYQIKDGNVSVFMKGDELESPNGLLFKDGKLLVAAWGLTKDWSTTVPGRLYTIDPTTKTITYITEKPLGNLDGLEIDNAGNYIVSDWVAGKVYRVDGKGTSTLIMKGPKGAADLAFVPSKNLIVVPEMQENKITAFQYK